jgi:hypothetical protein
MKAGWSEAAQRADRAGTRIRQAGLATRGGPSAQMLNKR